MRITLLLCFLLVFNLSYGQLTDEQRKKALDDITSNEKQKNEERAKRVNAYLKENSIDRWNRSEVGVTTFIYDIDSNGRPIYLSTDNAGAAVTTGAAVLNDENQFGFGLTGEGILVGVWDGGLVRNTHIELSGRVSQLDGASTFDNHANHVTGTIGALGIRSDAKGMAPNVTVINYDFADNLTEITDRANSSAGSLLLSNHSYGIPGGWRQGSWLGDPTISDQEDWRFGFYDSRASTIDQVSYNAPNYLMVWSAGNNRGNSGDGSFPTNGPYDVITSYSTAKNILTVGAVNKIDGGYSGPESVVMSSFSSWGPVDDGRIKPDIVGAGVSILSSYGGADDAYGFFNGTSMSAPNVTGTLALLQELNKKLYGDFLQATEIKALAIHTAHEAGRHPGPDYAFGWGLMNGKDAGRLMLEENGNNKIIENHFLNNNEDFLLNLDPAEGSEVKITICWADLPGTPTATQLDPLDLMLVNDLDMRVSNDTEEYFPYVLDPLNPSREATTGDNFRDNIEQIEFVATGEPYTLTINHKGTLLGGGQAFSLVISYEKEGSNTYYWIGGNNSEWTNPANWSLTSAGIPGTQVPSVNDAVIFDNNSFAASEEESNQEDINIFVLNEDVEIGSLRTLSSKQINFNLNGNDITVYGSLTPSLESTFFSGEGNIILKNNGDGRFSLGGDIDSFDEVSLIVDYENDGELEINTDLNVKGLTILRGTVSIRDSDLSFEQLSLENQSTLNIENSQITANGDLSLDSQANLNLVSSELSFKGETSLETNGMALDATLSLDEGSLTVVSDISVSELNLMQGTTLNIPNGVTLSINSSITATGFETSPISITSAGQGTINYDKNDLICFDYVNVSNVDIVGEGAFNVGPNGSIENASGWQAIACEAVVFSNFTSNTICENGVEKFTNESNGQNLSSKWYLDGELVSEDESAIIQFPELREYQVELEVTNGDDVSDSYTTSILPRQNTLQENEVLLSGNQLASRSPADSYQWFNNGVLLEGETGRTLNLVGLEGTFFVVTSDETCSRKSIEFEFRVTSTEEDLFESEYNLYPNPANERLNIDLQSAYSGVVEINMLDLSGRKVYSKSYNKNGFQFNETINTTNLSNGLYVIRITQGQSETSKLVAIEK